MTDAPYEFVIADKKDLVSVADAIRVKSKSSAQMVFPNDFVSNVNSIVTEEYIINVTTDSGATVSATNGSDTVLGVSDGTCSLKVHSTGNWTLGATLDGAESTTSIVNVTDTFTTNLIFFRARVIVNTSAESVVTVTKGDVSFTKTADDTGILEFTIRDPGEWSVVATKNGKSLSEIANVVVEKAYNIYLPVDMMTLNSNSWATISGISEAGTAKNYWSVGDCKAVDLSGTMGTLELDTTLFVYILGFDHNKELEGSGITFGGFRTASGSSGVNVCLVDSNYSTSSTSGTKYFSMSHWNYYNFGGWSRCDMRYDILGSTDVAPQGYGARAYSGQVGYAPSETCATNPVPGSLMSCLPADLRAVMKPMVKYSDNVAGGTNVETNVSATTDYLPLLAEFEIFGARTYANSYEQNYQAQYEYFSAGNSRIKYRHSATSSSARWWERSPYCSTNGYFCRVDDNGNANRSYSYHSYGVAPAFLL